MPSKKQYKYKVIQKVKGARAEGKMVRYAKTKKEAKTIAIKYQKKCKKELHSLCQGNPRIIKLKKGDM